MAQMLKDHGNACDMTHVIPSFPIQKRAPRAPNEKLPRSHPLPLAVVLDLEVLLPTDNVRCYRTCVYESMQTRTKIFRETTDGIVWVPRIQPWPLLDLILPVCENPK